MGEGAGLVGAAARRDSQLLVAVVILLWVPLVLVFDRDGALASQWLFGAACWALLVALAGREAVSVRVQVGLVVVFATLVEYTFSALLHVYVYRLDNVPAFVPPGHGLVYLAALCLARSHAFRAHQRALITATVIVGGGYSAWGLLRADRPDLLGAVWFVCLLGFLRWGRSTLLYVGAFIVVTYLELLGTRLGAWRWHPVDPTGLVGIGNPPSGAAGGYGWFDLAATFGSPRVLRLLGWAGRASRARTRPDLEVTADPATTLRRDGAIRRRDGTGQASVRKGDSVVNCCPVRKGSAAGR